MNGPEPLEGLERLTRKPDETLFEEGEPGDCMYLLLSGRVQLVRRQSHGRRELAVLEAGDFFGEMSLVEDEPRSATAIALTPVELQRVRSGDFERLLHAEPEVSIRLLRRLSRNLRRSDAQLAAALECLDEKQHRVLAARSEGAPPAPEPPEYAHFELRPDGTRWPLRGTVSRIGRRDSSTGIVPDVELGEVDPLRSVSRCHARLFRKGWDCELVEEIAVKYGTWVNDLRLRCGEPVALQDGDRVKLGVVELVFRLHPSPPRPTFGA